MAEMCLWTTWTHVGDLVSEEVSRIVIMNAEAFCRFVIRFLSELRAFP